MKLYLLLYACLFLVQVTVSSQPDKKHTDSLQLFSMINKADYFFEKEQFDSAIATASLAAEMAITKKNYHAQSWALVKMAEVLIEQKQLEKAGEVATQINKIATKLNDSLLVGISLMQMGQVKMYDEYPDEAILLFDKSITSGLGKYSNKYLALAFSDLGYAWSMKNEYERQAQFTHKAISIYEQLGDDAGIAMGLGNLSAVYYQIGQKEKAIEYGKQSLKYREKTGDMARLSITCCNLSQYYLGINIDEATKYQELCLKYARQSGSDARMIHSYITSSLIANGKKNNKEAFEYELKVIDLLEKSKSNQRQLARRYIAAAIYNDMLKYDSLVTIEYYNKSIRMSQELGNKDNLKDAYLYLSNYHNSKKNYSEAYINYKKHILYRDSVISMEKEEKIAELEQRYETNKKDAEIERLNNEQRIKQLEIEKQKALVAGNVALALQKQNEIDLLSKSRELQEIKIREQEERLAKQILQTRASAQQLQLAEQEKQLKEKQLTNQKKIRNLLLGGLFLVVLLGAISFNRFQLKKKLEKQTDLLAMRNNISQDLHDDIGASLSNINILNELARRNIGQPEKSKEYLAKASEDVQRISESLSDIVWNINPRYDDPDSLFIRMKRYAADMFDGKDINGHFDFPASGTNMQMTMTQRRDMYLVFKEAVNNLVKYSGAKNAIVKIDIEGKLVSMQIKDDGKGFDVSGNNTGNGLQNMKQRTKVMGGSLDIVSKSGEGTAINFQMKMD
jgi:two-component system, NarL family, sensor histidine kinase UhpB